MNQSYKGKPQYLSHRSPTQYPYNQYERVDEKLVTDLNNVVAWELCNSTHLCKCASQCRWAIVPRSAEEAPEVDDSAPHMACLHRLVGLAKNDGS